MAVGDDRQDTRYTFTSDVIVDDSVFTTSIDISLGGIYIKTATVLEEKSVVSVNIPGFDFTTSAMVRFSKKGAGTGLKFEIASNDQWDKLASIIDSVRQIKEESTEKPTLLLVDDSKVFREELKEKLAEAGYSVAEAVDGMDAIKQMNMYPFHAVVTDLFMERIDGFKLIALIRQAPDHKDKPIIAISGKSDKLTVSHAMRAGANYFIPKNEDILKEVIKTLCIILGCAKN